MGNENEIVNAELVATTTNVLDVQERASIDMQIATAKKYARSLDLFKQQAIEYATIDEETAESCIYRRPVGKDANGKQTYAEGMSVRMAEIVGACFGNLRVASRVIEQTDRYVKAQGVAHDLQTNFFASSEVIESTVDRWGKPYNERMRVVVAKAALAKARRDATFQVVPRALAKPVEKAVRNLLYGDGKSMSKRRATAEQWIKKLGIDEQRVYDALGVVGIEDMHEKQLEILTGLRTAIKEGDVSIDEAFPVVKKDKFAEATKNTVPEEKKPEESSKPQETKPAEADGNLFQEK